MSRPPVEGHPAINYPALFTVGASIAEYRRRVLGLARAYTDGNPSRAALDEGEVEIIDVVPVPTPDSWAPRVAAISTDPRILARIRDGFPSLLVPDLAPDDIALRLAELAHDALGLPPPPARLLAMARLGRDLVDDEVAREAGRLEKRRHRLAGK
jgi:hypothetical protein